MSGPLVDAAFKVGEAVVAVCGEELRDLHAAGAVVAVDQQVAVPGELVEPAGDLPHGDVDAALDGGGPALVVLADVHEQRGVLAAEAFRRVVGTQLLDHVSYRSSPSCRPRVVGAPMQLYVPEEALATLRRLFTTVEGTCEPWRDEEVVRRTLIRGAMEYARSGGADFPEMAAVAAELRAQLEGASA